MVELKLSRKIQQIIEGLTERQRAEDKPTAGDPKSQGDVDLSPKRDHPCFEREEQQ